MSLKNKMDNYLNGPQRVNDTNFCKEYLSLSEKYFELADQTVLLAIDSAYNQILVDKARGKSVGQFDGLTNSQLKQVFMQKKVDLLKTISPSVVQIIQTIIDDYLRKNKRYASDCSLIVPNVGHLKVTEYLLNYEQAQNALVKLNLLLGKGFK